MAGALFVIPSIFVLLALSWIYAAHGDVAWVGALFDGVKPAVLALIVAAFVRIASKSLKTPLMWGVAAFALLAFRGFGAPFPLVVAAAGALGYFGVRIAPRAFGAGSAHGGSSAEFEPGDPARAAERSFARAARIGAVCIALWWGPVALAGAAFGWDDVLVTQGLFFSRTAVVTFGGAYAVLPYVAEHSVETYGWLAAHEMVDGLGLAESTPGPLIMVLQFVGFLGGWRDPGALPPWLGGLLSALMTTWVTFLPCFLWVLVGAPFVEQLRGVRALSAALATITAAVAGVMLNLALWFGVEVLAPSTAGGAREVDRLAVAIALGAWWGMRRWRWPAPAVLTAAAALGALRLWFGGE